MPNSYLLYLLQKIAESLISENLTKFFPSIESSCTHTHTYIIEYLAQINK